MSRFAYVAVAVPPLVLAGVGVTHPTDLTMASSEYWRNLHIATLAIFPLLGFAPWIVARGRILWVSWVAGVLGFLYAAFYTALDVLSGIGAGGLEHDGMGMAIGTMFHLGNALGGLGSYFFIAACAFAGGAAFRWYGVRTLPGTVVVLVGSVLFLERHIYFPVGVIGQLCLAIGWVLVVAAIRRRPAVLATQAETSQRA